MARHFVRERMARRMTLAAAGLFCMLAVPAAAQEPDLAAKVAEVKQTLGTGLAAVRKYEWVETTRISLKGEEKSSKQNQCYYGADGKVQKIPLPGQAAAKKPPRGLRGKIAENKKEDMADYMEAAVALVKQYVPPDAARVQASKDAGKASIHPLAPDNLQIQFRDYQKPGDVLSVYLNPTTNQLKGLRVSSYLEDAKDLVTLDIEMATLPDGALYASSIVLNGQAKEIKVDIRNTGYRVK